MHEQGNVDGSMSWNAIYIIPCTPGESYFSSIILIIFIHDFVYGGSGWGFPFPFCFTVFVFKSKYHVYWLNLTMYLLRIWWTLRHTCKNICVSAKKEKKEKKRKKSSHSIKSRREVPQYV